MLRPRPVLATVASLVLAASVTALAAAGHPQLQAYFQSTLKSADYQQKTFARVAKTWKQPKRVPALGKKTVVQAVIAQDGTLASVFVSMESGSKAWDTAALKAVNKAAPFDPLPAGYSYPSVEVHFHVEWAN